MSINRENQINYIEIQARDLGLAKDFFGKLFGWKFEDYGSDYCAFSDGRLEGGFARADKAASMDTGSVLVIFYAEDLESSLARVTECGGSVVRDIFSFPGGRRFHFADPNGNEFAIWSDK
jgi:predicted enzyme related to lactoylglutathione lyase